LGHVARTATEFLGQRQGTVGLSIGVLARSNDRIHTGATGHGVERRLKTGGEDVEGIGHNRSIVTDRSSPAGFD
jgi:hypothetical protein